MRLVESLYRRRAIADDNLDSNLLRSLLRSSSLRKRKLLDRRTPALADRLTHPLSPRFHSELPGFGETNIVETFTLPAPTPAFMSAGSADTTESLKFPTPTISPTAGVQTAMAAASSTSSGSTVFVTLAPQMGPPPKHMKGDGGLSEGTEHALIVAGSIGATIIVLFLFWIFLRMRKGLCLSEACMFKRRNRYSNIKDVTPPLGRWSAAGREWDRKAPLDAESIHSRTMEGLNGLPNRPSPSLSRNNSGTSQRTLVRTIGRRPSDARTENWPIRPNATHSAAPSSPILPANARLTTQVEDNTAVSPYDDDRNTSYSSLPSYLRGAKNIPPRRPPNEASRFSWTNSQAPKTPVTATDSTVPYQRYSIATSRSSVARYRTVDSWVGNQAGRLDEEAFKAYLRAQEAPAVPDMPKTWKNRNEELKDKGRHKTNYSDATVFRAHPGTEVVIPRASLIASDVLDGQVSVRNARDDRSL